MKRITFFALMMIVTGWAAVAGAESGDEILGKWSTTDDKSQVVVFKEKNKYCARIVSLKEPNRPADDKEGMAGKPKTDRRNPDPNLRNRPMVGLTLMTDFTYAGNSVWEDGKIYDPENGKTYKCKMTLVATNRLEVRGYIGFSLLGRTVTWTR